jgi:hypothetical protein
MSLPQARMSFVVDENVCYKHDGKTASCLSKNRSGYRVVRRLICVSGFVVDFEQMGRCYSPNGLWAPFVFLLLWKALVLIVSVNVNRFRQSHSNLILHFRVLDAAHFNLVHHFHQFVFLPLWKALAIIVSKNVTLFRQSHSNLVLNFHVLTVRRFLVVLHVYQFIFFPPSTHSTWISESFEYYCDWTQCSLWRTWSGWFCSMHQRWLSGRWVNEDSSHVFLWSKRSLLIAHNLRGTSIFVAFWS